jgi:preprotein translocase subunit SecB
LFPFARQIIAGAVQDAGFPPLMLDPINFEAIYMNQAAAQGEGLDQLDGPTGGDGSPTVQ